jgi:hypothetical protein
MNIHDFVPQYAKMLKNLSQWMNEAAEVAKQKGFELDVLANARLAPDMFPFAKQVQSACDTAKFSAAYLTGTEPPVHPDTETTFAELHARVNTVLQYLETITAAAVAGADDRKVSPKFLQGKWVKGDDFAIQMSLPNFYFHVVTAYAILRHNGVTLGKKLFLGSLPIRD